MFAINFIPRKTFVSVAVLAGVVAISGTALAESDPMARHQEKIGMGVRFPGDVAFKEGTIRLNGPEKGPYVERCTWHLNPNISKGFGITHTCVRHTLENTK